ncbi:TPA: hypothetical protein ACH3X2_007158 [Trebouxia sp. C0005]
MTYLVVANTGLTGTQESGCNAVQDTLLQAIASINKGVSVGCKKPLDHVFKQPQHRLRNSVADVWIRGCQTSVNYAQIYSRSGTLTTTLCLATSRSSHRATGESCGHAPIVQQDALMSGRQLCLHVPEGPNAHIVKGEQYASTTLWLPRHQDNSSIGTRRKTPTHQSRHLLAAVFGLNGSAKSAAMSGELKLQGV